MARITQTAKLEQENAEQALVFFEQMLAQLPDPRRAQGLRYPLRSVVVIALMAMICGSDDAEAMELWGDANQEWLSGFLPLPHGTPTQDVFLSVFASLNPIAFGAVLQAWAAMLASRLVGMDKHIAVDGKTSRRSYDTAAGQPALHTVSAYLTEAGLVLGQTKTDVKSNEITAIPELLRLLDLRGATITIDAMGCQTAIANDIVTAGGNYVLAVKENQPSLHADIVATFAEASDERRRTVDEQPRPAVETAADMDKGHGRIEKRIVRICRDLSWLHAPTRWAGLTFVVEVTRERTTLSTSIATTETSYYIGSDRDVSAAHVGRMIRRHWAIENELHWV